MDKGGFPLPTDSVTNEMQKNVKYVHLCRRPIGIGANGRTPASERVAAEFSPLQLWRPAARFMRPAPGANPWPFQRNAIVDARFVCYVVANSGLKSRGKFRSGHSEFIHSDGR
jgi:hypothetical protein